MNYEPSAWNEKLARWLHCLAFRLDRNVVATFNPYHQRNREFPPDQRPEGRDA